MEAVHQPIKMKVALSFFFFSFGFIAIAQEGECFSPNSTAVQPRITGSTQKYQPIANGYFKERTSKGEVLLDSNKKVLLDGRAIHSISNLDDRYLLLMESIQHYEVYDLETKSFVFERPFKKFKYHPHLKEGRIYIVKDQDVELVYDANFQLILNAERNENLTFELTNKPSAVVMEDKTQSNLPFSLWSTVTYKKVSADYQKITSPRLVGYPIAQLNYNQVGMLNYEGKEIVPVQYENVEQESKHFVVTQNYKVGIYNEKGELVIPIQYQDYRICQTRKDKNYVFVMIDDDKLLVYNQTGQLKLQLSGRVMDSRKAISNDFLMVKIGEKQSWIHLPTIKLVDIPYEALIATNEQRREENTQFILKRGEFYGVVDLLGKVVKPFQFVSYEPTKDEKGTRNGIALKDKKGVEYLFKTR